MIGNVPGMIAPTNTLGELAGSVARAMGGPLTAIGMAVDRLSAGGSEAGERQELRLVQEQVRRLGSLAEILRVMAQPAPSTSPPATVNGIVEELAALVREALARDGIQVSTRLSPGLPPIRSSPRRVREVLLALLYNARLALEAWDGPRKVVLETARCHDGRVKVLVRDSGPGIPPGEEEQIFLPWVSGWGRNGMGLSFSRLALLEEEGDLDVELTDGPGACFAVRLPPSGSGEDLASNADTEAER